MKQEQTAQLEQIKIRETEKLAISLKNRMTEKNARKIDDEFDYVPGNGPKLSKAKLHIIKDKTILEGEEDIFVFKAPSERPPTREEAEKLLKEAEAQFNEKKHLPAFDIRYADDAAPQKEMNNDPQFSDSIIQKLGNLTVSAGPQSKPEKTDDDLDFSIPEDIKVNHKPRSKRSLIALAASVVVMITVSVVVITRPTYIEKDAVANWADGDQAQQKPAERGLASMRARSTADAKTVAEDRVKAEADAEFRQLLSKWRKDNKKETSTQ